MVDAPHERADEAAGHPGCRRRGRRRRGDCRGRCIREDEQGLMGENRRSAALATLCLVLFLTFLDITIVSVALAGIQTELRPACPPCSGSWARTR